MPERVRIDLEADPVPRRGAPAVDARAPLTAAPAAAPEPAPAPAPAPEPQPRPPPTAGARLVRADGPDHPLVDPTTIGRGPDRDIQVDDNRVSRRHAVVRRDGDRWTITDEGSSNGTRRNGSRIAPTAPVPLSDGDEIGIGPVTFTFRSDR